MNCNKNYREFKTEVLVVGAGLAGLRAALTAATYGAKVVLVSRSPIGMGGASFSKFAEVWGYQADHENPDQHLKEIEKVSMGVNLDNLSGILAYEAADRLDDLVKLGVTLRKRHGKPEIDVGCFSELLRCYWLENKANTIQVFNLSGESFRIQKEEED